MSVASFPSLPIVGDTTLMRAQRAIQESADSLTATVAEAQPHKHGPIHFVAPDLHPGSQFRLGSAVGSAEANVRFTMQVLEETKPGIQHGLAPLADELEDLQRYLPTRTPHASLLTLFGNPAGHDVAPHLLKRASGAAEAAQLAAKWVNTLR